MQTKTLQMKRALRTALLVLLLSAIGMGKGYAWDFEVDGIYYDITSSSTNTVGVTGSSLYDVDIPETVVYEGVTYSVTSIERLAFGFSSITSVTIPSSITAIKLYAFHHCSALTVVNFNATNCIIMGESDGSGNPFGYAFANCPSLTTVNIGENVEHIPSNGFDACTSLIIVSITDIASWCSIEFDSNPLYIAHNLYLNGELLTDLVIPETVSEIKKKAFKGATCLTSLILPNSIISIGDEAFCDCENITGELIFPNGFISTGYWAFRNANKITAVNIPDSATNIGDACFQGCSNLQNIVLGNSVSYIGAMAFNGCPITSIDFPETLDTIGSAAFLYCSHLTSITIPSSLTYLGDNAFGECSNISKVYYYANNCVTSDYCNTIFGNCFSLCELTIGSDVRVIPRYTFSGCTNLNTIIALGTVPPIIETNAFLSISPVATLFVPCGSQLSYFTNWNIFEYNNIHEDCTPRPISIDPSISGGSVASSIPQATMGQEIMITVTPNAGMKLASITAYNTNNPSQIVPITTIGNSFRFIMPPYSVTINATFETCASLEDNNIITAKVYPNPTNSHVRIETEDLRHIRINSMLGQVIYESTATGNEFEYDFSKHGEGIYLVHIETASGVITKRVVVAR